MLRLKSVDESEYVVGSSVVAAPFPPSFDDASVVAVDCVVRVVVHGEEDESGKEFEADCFCPSDVTAVTTLVG
jgi:hypothetical protein